MGEANLKLEAKKLAFAENPNKFVNLDECLLVVMKKDGKTYSVANNCRSLEDVYMADGFSRESLQNRRDQIRLMQMQNKQSSGIVVAQPGEVGKIMNGQAQVARG